MAKAGIPVLSVAELSRLIEKKEVSPVEATEAYLYRIDREDFKFNSYLTVSRKEALQAAAEAERAILQGGYRGPLHGVPVAVKDQLWTKGIRTTGGSRILVDLVPEEDATAVANLKEAGAVLLGKLNMTEFAMGGGGERYRTPRNPWNLETYTGASSSGSGAATAAYLCATSLGEDTGGSIRYPASWCGVVGLRPSWGRVSRNGLMRGAWSMDTVGPISRTVEDAAITLGAIAGRDPKDPYTWDTPVPDYRRALNGDIKGVRVGVVREQLDSHLVDTEVRDGVLTAVSALRDLGASVEEVSIPMSAHAETIFTAVVLVEAASDHRELIRDRLADYLRGIAVGFLTGSIIPSQVYHKAQRLRGLLRQQTMDALERCDVLVSPTLGTSAQPIGDYLKPSAVRKLPLLTYLFSLTSGPAITVPCGVSCQGLPIGLQIGGRPGEDEIVLKVAHAYQQSTSWHTLRPPTVSG